MLLWQGVATNLSSYTFIVDNVARTYTITLNVTYQVGPMSKSASGEAILTFTSDTPTGTLAVQQTGTANAFIVPGQNYISAA